ncbi:hypothetical protein AAC03nite_12260 [Alicyclobacillus acidoterrestris]|uniref:staygreen family protein n=1 Tax=Alicyclobacillus suci TaxID=2816080 RepID=UPI001195E722|nr:staygreen family protein [Alicyclobacillus suci]GEO25441.1 hypothetical protein AAC03nite_12260 [Alicyclobacillus acidoterrestris]
MTQRKSPKFRPNKVHTVFLEGVNPSFPIAGRHYTLTHSDRTGDLYLSVGLTYNPVQLERPYIRFMRDEVRGVWLAENANPGSAVDGGTDEFVTTFGPTVQGQREDGEPLFVTHIYVHVSGGRVYGRAKQRDYAFQKELPRALRAIRHADAYLFTAHPELDDASIVVHFESDSEKYHRTEAWGRWKDYTIPLLRKR